MAKGTTAKITLTATEQAWLCAQRITRISDGNSALIYPMGAEIFLAAMLLKICAEYYKNSR